MIPTVLKKELREEYKDHLGPLMERYIDSLISECGLRLMPEREILAIYAKQGAKKGNEVCDFAILGTKTILVESKAIEPSDIVKSTAISAILKRTLKESFLKAIAQGQRTASILNKSDSALVGTHYLVVITHEEFWYPTGRTVCDLIDQNLEEEIAAVYGEPPIPLEHIGFITIGMFEKLCAMHSSGEIDIEDVLVRSFERLEVAENKRSTFEFTIDEVLGGGGKIHRALSKRASKFFDELTASMQGNRAFWKHKQQHLLYSHQKLFRALDTVI